MKRKEIYSFLKRNKNFAHLWISQILQLVTINMVNFLMLKAIYEKTNSALAVSFLWVFYYLPAFFVGPFSGLVVDRFSKRRILIFTNILQSITMLLYLLIGKTTYPIFTFVFLYSLMDEFYAPAESATLPGLVKVEDLPVANSLFFATSQGALLIGFGLGGLLMRLLGQNNIIILSAVFLFLAAVSVRSLPKDKGKTKTINDFFSFWSELKLGYSYIAEKRIVLFPMILSVAFGILLTVFGVSIPVVASKLLNIRIEDAGPVLIIPLGLGALLGMTTFTRLSKKYRKKLFIKTGVLMSFVIFMIIALLLPFFGKFIIPITVVLMFFLGFAGLLVFIPNQTLLQENIPPNLRGRVFGTLNFVYTIITLPFLLFSATIIDAFGVRLFIFLAGFSVFLLMLFFKKAESSITTEQINMQNGH